MLLKRLLLLILCLPILSCKQVEEIKSSEAQLRASLFPIKTMVDLPDSLSIEGHWKHIRFGSITRIPVLNAVRRSR